MNFDWVLLSEGIGQDSRGAITAIGLNQNILLAAKMPTTTRRAVIAHFVDRENRIEQNTEFTFTLNVISPSGKIEVAQTVQGQFANNQLIDVPASVDLPIQFSIPVGEYGVYRITVLLKLANGLEVSGEAVMYVENPPAES